MLLLWEVVPNDFHNIALDGRERADKAGGVGVRLGMTGQLWLSRVGKHFSDDLDRRKPGVQTMRMGNGLFQMSNVKGVLIPNI